MREFKKDFLIEQLRSELKRTNEALYALKKKNAELEETVFSLQRQIYFLEQGIKRDEMAQYLECFTKNKKR